MGTMSKAERHETSEEVRAIIHQWAHERDIPSLQGRIVESMRLLDGWNRDQANALCSLKVNVVVWSLNTFVHEAFGANWASKISSQNVEFWSFSIADAMLHLEEEASKDKHNVRLLNNLIFDVEAGSAEDEGSNLSDMDEDLRKEFPLLYADDVDKRKSLGFSISVEPGLEDSMAVTNSAGNGCSPRANLFDKKQSDVAFGDDQGKPLLESMRSNCQDASFRFQGLDSEPGVTGHRHPLGADAFRTEESIIEELPRGISESEFLAPRRKNVLGKPSNLLDSPVLNEQDQGDAIYTPNVVPESQAEVPTQDQGPNGAQQAMAMLASDQVAGTTPVDKELAAKQERQSERKRRLANRRKKNLSTVMAPRGVSRPDIGASMRNLKATRHGSTAKDLVPAPSEKETEEPIFSGLGILTECFAPTCTDKEGPTLNEDDAVPERRSKRLQVKHAAASKAHDVEQDGEEEKFSTQKRSRKRPIVSECPAVAELPKRLRSAGVVPEPPHAVSQTPKRRVQKRKSTTTSYMSPKSTVKGSGARKSVSETKIDFTKPPDKVGCSKCRWKGCKKCRGYTLAEKREYDRRLELGSKEGDLSLGNPSGRSTGRILNNGKEKKRKKSLQTLRGFKFLVTILDKPLKIAILEEINSMGGKIETNVSNILKSSTALTRTSTASHSDTLLVTNNLNNKTIKSIFARVAGIPFISPEWILACKKNKKAGTLNSRSPNVLLSRNSDGIGQILKDLRILLVIDQENSARELFATLLKHLGATCIPSLDPELGHGSCDLILHDSSSDLPALKAEIHRVERIARRLRIPSHPLSWLTDGIMSGGTFDPPLPSAEKNNSEAIGLTVIPGTDDEESEDEMPPPSTAADNEEAPEHYPIDRNAPSLVIREGSPRENSRHFNTPMSGPLHEKAHTDPSSMNVLSQWRLIDPCDNPDGFKKSPIRQYFRTAVSGDEKISIDDFVKLLPDPGRQGPKIAQLVALWKQTGMPEGNKIFGKFRRYYKFDETSITLMQITKEDFSNRIFQTNHFEDNLPLTAIISKCNVEVLHSPTVTREVMAEDTESSGGPVLYCTAFYDYETGALLALH